MPRPDPFLIIDRVYDVYTKRETISGVVARCIAILSFAECSRIRFDLGVLGISEKFIPNVDVPLEQHLKDQNIYHLRALQPAGETGPAQEYLVWDDIINRDRTVQINVTHIYDTLISIDNELAVNPTQIVNEINQFVHMKYGSQVLFSMTRRATRSNDDNKEEVLSTDELRQKQLDEAMVIIGELFKFNNVAIPEIRKLSELNFTTRFENIQSSITEIQNNVNIISASIR